jgi:hypothetical protein
MDLMSERQWKVLEVVKRIEKGELTVGEGAMVVGLSKRQMRRIRAGVKASGRTAVVHGNRGRAPGNQLAAGVRRRVVALASKKYVGFNDQQLTEKLVEVEGVAVSRSSVRRLLRGAGLPAARSRRPPKHRRRRDRKAQPGMMILWDGSRHDWLEGRGPMLCLMGAIDDATGELLPGGHFVDQECSAGYLRVLRAIVEDKGIPCSAYMDQHGSLRRNDDHWTLEEELRGEQEPTQVGRAMKALEIEVIFALSAQAKGRVERLWGTLQDRLTSELRLAKARTADQANAVLEVHRRDHNRRFAVAAADATPAWRAVRASLDIARICAFHYESTVGNDNTVRLHGQVIDIPPGPGRRSYARARVEVRQFLDGSWHVYQDTKRIATKAATAVEDLRPRKQRRRPAASRAFRRAIERVAASLP